MKIKFSPFALTDLEESVTYYNLQQENLGVEFAEKVNLPWKGLNKTLFNSQKNTRQLEKQLPKNFLSTFSML